VAIRRHSILVVDDDPLFRELYRTALRFEGFDVSTASDGFAALQSIERNPPSLVILDINMPCLDGWGVLDELSRYESTRAIPVIVVTASDIMHATVEATSILTKPVAPDELLPVIRRRLAAQASV
jgi:two-component system, OmpR family, response regulator MprA